MIYRIVLSNSLVRALNARTPLRVQLVAAFMHVTKRDFHAQIGSKVIPILVMDSKRVGIVAEAIVNLVSNIVILVTITFVNAVEM